MKGDLFPVLKGNNLCKRYNFLIKNRKYANDLLTAIYLEWTINLSSIQERNLFLVL
jgi:hypothetical protein